MMTLLPSGAIGLVVASLIAAFMSASYIALKLGSSYVVHDTMRFIRPDASEQRFGRSRIGLRPYLLFQGCCWF